MGIKRCPSFSKRPGFPCGLRVLLLDADQAQRQDCEQRLKECSYEVGGGSLHRVGVLLVLVQLQLLLVALDSVPWTSLSHQPAPSQRTGQPSNSSRACGLCQGQEGTQALTAPCADMLC